MRPSRRVLLGRAPHSGAPSQAIRVILRADMSDKTNTSYEPELAEDHISNL